MLYNSVRAFLSRQPKPVLTVKITSRQGLKNAENFKCSSSNGFGPVDDDDEAVCKLVRDPDEAVYKFPRDPWWNLLPVLELSGS